MRQLSKAVFSAVLSSRQRNKLAGAAARDSGPQPAPGASYYAALVVATFLMASGFISGKILLNFGFAALLLVGWRFFVAAFAILPMVFMSRQALFPKLTPAQYATVILIGLLQTAGTLGLTFLSLRYVSAATSGILLFTNPVWVALLAPWALGESLSKIRVLGLICGVLGVALALGGGAISSTDNFLQGDIVGLGGALCWSLSTIVNKRARLPIGTWTLSFWQMLTGALVLLAVAYAQGEHWPKNAGLVQWGWFLWLAIPGSAGSFGLWFLALRKGGATRSSGYLFLAPLFTVFQSAVILGTSLSLGQAVGGVLIGLSLWLVNRGEQHGHTRA
jgi:drug/metabolite transporter (DMT)-like permease